MNEAILQAGAQAFGDGSHPTTRGVLAVLDALDPAIFTPRIACDMGAGSGIVSLALTHRFGCRVMAVDIKRSSVDIMRENFRSSGRADQCLPLHADGFEHPEITGAAPFDLVVMNILAEPLMRLAAAAERHLAQDGVLILSGILIWEEEQIRQSYQMLGLELTARILIGDWVTLLFQKP